MTLLHELRRRGGRYGVATMCVGVGQGQAALFELMSVAERYLVLGLRLGKHVDGLVDAYYGPAELQEQVDAEDPIGVAQLAADADELFAELDDGWLADQVHGCATYAHVLAGDPISYSDEVEGLPAQRPGGSTTWVYEEVHAKLDELLPGYGSLLVRRQAWRELHRCPGEKAVAVLGDLVPVLRACTSRLLELPVGEELTLEPVQDEPWWAFNYYQGNLHSRVVLNTDIPTSGRDLLRLVGHEVYPGHHTEHAVKEQPGCATRAASRRGSSSFRLRRPSQ